MAKTSKIKQIVKFAEEPWSNDKFTIWYHTIELENGDTGNIGTQEERPDWLKSGYELEYEIHPSKNPSHPAKIKKVAQQKLTSNSNS